MTSSTTSSHSVTGGCLQGLERIHHRLNPTPYGTSYDNHAPSVSVFSKASLNFKRIRGMSSPNKESGSCLSPSVADHPFGPTIDHLGNLLPHQLANQTRAPPRIKLIQNFLSFQGITCIHAFHVRLDFAPRDIAIPTPSRQSHEPLIHSHSIMTEEQVKIEKLTLGLEIIRLELMNSATQGNTLPQSYIPSLTSIKK
ncbi:hypothetical protein E5676_scaffold23G00250 [Cucumis melo var. makuwa]|uniref:Uncharacterized protein n=1 Tax=Cucumis melo var. makuwa TaxID=1194695 RepID=A0A5D3BDL3_CUCMM|nr:hypothetical protein E5676_scaffold23G00250 [Cucumis melo var. makuwa]